MRLLKRSLVAMTALTLGLGLIACGDDPPAGPEGSAASASGARPAMTGDPVKRPDPLVTKTYRAEACYYGSLSLKQARDAYVASLAGGEPSADKIPQFGADPDDANKAVPGAPPAPTGAPTASPTASPTGAATAKATSTAKATAAPTAKATTAPTAKASGAPTATGMATAAVSAPPAGSAPTRVPPQNMKQQIRFDQFIRHCNTAISVSVKDAADPDLDAALKEFSEYALPLAKVITEANQYYAGEIKDNFEKGKQYHACLTGTGSCEVKDKNAKPVTNAWPQLDERLSKLKAAVDKFKGAKPLDKSGYEESQKVSDQAVVEATELLLAFDAKPVDLEKAKAAIGKLEATTEKLKAFGDNKEKPDPWGKAVPPQLSLLVTEAKALVDKPADQIPPGKIYKIVSIHNRVLEKNFSALQTKLREAAGGAPGRGQVGPGPRNKVTPKLPPAHPK